jgi:cytochrome c oxidase subunit 2
MALSTRVVDSTMIYIMAFVVLLFLAIVFFLVYFTLRYRRGRHPQAEKVRESRWLEVAWIALPTLLVLTMFYYGLTGFSFLRKVPAGAMVVKVVARQWSWRFEYDNGFKTDKLIVPVGRPVALRIVSEDVIHSFFVPAFRIKQDAVPGMTTKAWFAASEPGSYEVLCAEYCGLLHSQMRSSVEAVPADQFARWYAGEDVEIAGIAPPIGPPGGEQLLSQFGCISCHSTDGSERAGPTFKGLFGSRVRVIHDGQPRTITVDEAYLREHILEHDEDFVAGYPNIMPSFKGKISDSELDQIIDYIEALK